MFLYTSFFVPSSQRLRCTRGQMRFLMNLLTIFNSAGFSALLNVRIYDSVYTYTALVIDMLQSFFQIMQNFK